MGKVDTGWGAFGRATNEEQSVRCHLNYIIDNYGLFHTVGGSHLA